MRVLLSLVLVLSSISVCRAQQRSVIRSGNRDFQKRVLSWNELKFQNIVQQNRDYSCGAAAVATVLRYYWGEDVVESDVLAVLALSLRPDALKDRTENGLSMADLKVVASRMGYAAEVGTLDTVAKLSDSKIPVVVSLKLDGQDHFVVYRGIRGNCVFVADPLRGNYRMGTHTFAQAWNQNAVFVVTPKGKTSSSVSRLDIRPEEMSSLPMNRQLVRQRVAGASTGSARVGF